MACPPFDWRPARPEDVAPLAAIYGDAARRLGPQVYSSEQVRAWASFAQDEAAFRRYVLDHDTWVTCAPGNGVLLGFCGVELYGGRREIHSLYVAADQTRLGIGRDARAHAGPRP
jgi:ribosomal protein S18 acetylase RimI-like enzyme